MTTKLERNEKIQKLDFRTGGDKSQDVWKSFQITSGQYRELYHQEQRTWGGDGALFFHRTQV